MILGASFDTIEENRAFADAQEFPFRLLSDTDRSVGAIYDVIRPADDPYAAYPQRVSFLIGRDGLVVRRYEVADVAAHANEVLADIRGATDR